METHSSSPERLMEVSVRVCEGGVRGAGCVRGCVRGV